MGAMPFVEIYYNTYLFVLYIIKERQILPKGSASLYRYMGL